jgi:hypothetical protein
LKISCDQAEGIMAGWDDAKYPTYKSFRTKDFERQTDEEIRQEFLKGYAIGNAAYASYLVED